VVREANLAAGRLLAIRPEYLLQKPLANFISPHDRRGFRHQLLALSQAQSPRTLELQLRAALGQGCPRR